MVEATGSNQGKGDEPRPLRRDWALLPLLGLLTLFLMALSAEWVSRRIFYESATTTLKCLVVNDPATGVRAIPNSVCSQKIFESELTEYRFNNCGHRADTECGPKALGTYRIVLVGSSFGYGMWVQREQSFAALLPGDLSQRTGRKIDLYNQAMQWGSPHSVDLRFKEVLAAKPDMILWALTPWDIENVQVTVPYVPQPDGPATGVPKAGEPGGAPEGPWQRIKVAFGKKTAAEAIRDGWGRVVEMLNQTRTVFLLQHFLYQSQSQTVKRYLVHGERAAFLEAKSSAAWLDKLRQFDGYAADVMTQARAAGVTVVAVMLPQRAQAAIISSGEWPAGFDPYKIGDQVRTIVESHGGTYLDVLHDFRGIPNPERYYFPVDGHIDVQGHALFSRVLAGALTRVLRVEPGLPATPSGGR